jgi:hypothetical protein
MEEIKKMYEELMRLAYNIEDKLNYQGQWSEVVNELQKINIDKLIKDNGELK